MVKWYSKGSFELPQVFKSLQQSFSKRILNYGPYYTNMPDTNSQQTYNLCFKKYHSPNSKGTVYSSVFKQQGVTSQHFLTFTHITVVQTTLAPKQIARSGCKCWDICGLRRKLKLTQFLFYISFYPFCECIIISDIFTLWCILKCTHKHTSMWSQILRMAKDGLKVWWLWL